MMLRQIKALTAVQLANLFGLNVLRHTRDPRARRKAWFLAGAWALVILVVIVYMGGLAFGLIHLGAEAAVPAYLTATASLFIFFLGAFTTGSTLFSPGGYDILCSLPLSRTAIVVSRFIRLYVEQLVLTTAVMVPGLSVYARLLRPEIGFYAACLIGIPAVPLFPLSAAALVGLVISAISSRMKHKALVEAGLSIAAVLAIFLLMPGLTGSAQTLTPEMLKELSALVLEVLGKVYPPALGLGSAIAGGSVPEALMFTALSALVAGGMVLLISSRFHTICRRLFSRSARHDYQMTTLRSDSLLRAMVIREFRRYFASGIYVTNTIIGPILGTLLCGMLCFTDPAQIRELLPIPVDIPGLVPFLMAGVFSVMIPSSVSISMEGKDLWILKTLPLDTKTILDAKLLMNLGLLAPFWLVSEVLMTVALNPSPLELVFQILIPALLILFSCVFGITANLMLPLLDWDNETSVVKQSASALVGGMGGLVVSLACLVLTILSPGEYSGIIRLAICIVLAFLTLLLYRKNQRFDLKQL